MCLIGVRLTLSAFGQGKGRRRAAETQIFLIALLISAKKGSRRASFAFKVYFLLEQIIFDKPIDKRKKRWYNRGRRQTICKQQPRAV